MLSLPLRLLRYALHVVFWAAIVIATILIVRAFDARGLPPIEAWHRALPGEFRAADAEKVGDLDGYLALEARLFRQLRERIYDAHPADSSGELIRYRAGSLADPASQPRDWNRTSWSDPPDELRAGALLLHGLSDSCYSMRSLAEVLRREGVRSLCLRVPGHGTVPGGLTAADWEDWAAAVRIGARAVRDAIGRERPFYLVGYSNGGALAVQYAVAAMDAGDLPPPQRVILLSPAIGVTAFGAFASWNRVLSRFQYFEQFAWQDLGPEFDPFKYVSFPKHAGDQIFRLTRELQADMARLASEGRTGSLPPILTFQSLVDATVHTDAIVDHLYAPLEGEAHELVLFDIRRTSAVDGFLKSEHERLLERLDGEALTYTFTLVTNAGPDAPGTVARTRRPGTAAVQQELGARWPATVYSLSHIAIPFPPDDPLYGADPSGPLPLGALAPRGERDMLVVPAKQFLRLRYNPFFDYVAERVREVVRTDLAE